MKKYDITIANKTNKTIGSLLINNKSKSNIENKNGVYKITCGDCDATYIGQTGRDLKTRFKEHTTNNNTSSAMGRHLFLENHKTTTKNLSLLHSIPKSYKLTLYEKYEITKHKQNKTNIINDITEFPEKHIFKNLHL